MKKGIGKEIAAVLLGFAIASVPTVVQNIDYNTNPRVHMATKLDWGSDDKTNIDDPEDFQAADRGTVNVVLFNGKAKPLANIDFTLYTTSEKGGSLHADKEVGNYSTDENGSFKLEHIQECKIYCLRESGAGVDEENSLEQYFVVSYEDAIDAYPEGVRTLVYDDTLSLIMDEDITSTYKVSIKWAPPINTPQKVRVNLLRNGKPYDSVELSEVNNWVYTFTNLLSTGEYTVEEDVPDNYTVYYQCSESDGNTSAILSNTIDLGSYSFWMLFAKVGLVIVLLAFVVLCWYFLGYLPRSRKRHKRRGEKRK